MSGNLDVRGYINPIVPGETEAGQREGMTPNIEIYTEDRSGTAIGSLIRSVRKGTIVEVKELHCLAPPLGRTDKRRRVLADRVEAIKERGGIIREWSTGRVSRGNMARMALLAYEQIATSGRARRRPKEGRPVKWVLSNHDREVIEGVWRSRRYQNDDERCVAIAKRTGKKISRAWLRLHFGSPHQR